MNLDFEITSYEYLDEVFRTSYLNNACFQVTFTASHRHAARQNTRNVNNVEKEKICQENYKQATNEDGREVGLGCERKQIKTFRQMAIHGTHQRRISLAYERKTTSE